MPQTGASSSLETLIDRRDDTCRYVVTRAGAGYLAVILSGVKATPPTRAKWLYRTEDAARAGIAVAMAANAALLSIHKGDTAEELLSRYMELDARHCVLCTKSAWPSTPG